jgi:hypothetical protein
MIQESKENSERREKTLKALKYIKKHKHLYQMSTSKENKFMPKKKICQIVSMKT